MSYSTQSRLLMVMAAGLAVNSAAFASGPAEPGTSLAEVMATFDPNGATDHLGMAKVDVVAERPSPEAEAAAGIDEAWLASKMAAMDAELARVFLTAPAKSAAALPNYRYLRGVAVPMHLNPMRIVVKTASKENALMAASKAGLAPANEGHRTVNGYTMVSLAQPLKGLEGADQAVERLLTQPGVSFAGPVFVDPFIAGGFYFPTTDSLVRVASHLDAAMVMKAEGAGFRIKNPSLGDMHNAMEVESTERNGFRVMAATNRLAESPSFVWASPAAIQSVVKMDIPTDPSFGSSWGHRNLGGTYNGLSGVADRDMDSEQAWDVTRGVASTLTLILDDGCQTDHPDINWNDGRDFTTGAASGVGSGAHSTACENHGTAVAGCVAERMNNGLGSVGTAPNTQILAAKIYDIDANTPCVNSFDAYSPTWLVNALNWGRSRGARITNASFGVGQDDAVSDMYTSTWNSGLVHFASAGNGGADEIGDPQVSYPSSAANVISVAALQPNGTLTSFSNYGTGLDLSAPGISVFSTDRTGMAGYNAGGDYLWFAGTSAASPCAAGVAALFFSQHPFATATQCRDAIFNSCDDLGTPGIDTSYARGFINAFRSLSNPAPTNDTCENATVIPSNAYNPSPVNVQWSMRSLLEPQETCGNFTGNNNSVFYRFTAPNSGVVSINTNGSSYDTVMSVFDGCVEISGNTRTDPALLACDDDGGTNGQSQITNLPVTVGQTIVIKVSKFGPGSGAGTLDFNFAFTATPPSNDNCFAATVITDTGEIPLVYDGPVVDTTLATVSACEAASGCGSSSGNGHSVYYRFTPTRDGFINADTFGSNYDTVLSMHSGCAFSISGGCFQPPLVVCNDDTPGSTQSAVSMVPVVAGQAYTFKIASYGQFAPGTLDFNLTFVPPVPTNDDCTDATVIPPVMGLYDPSPYSIYSATTESCENSSSCTPVTTRSVWYKFVAPSNGRITADTIGSDFNAVLSFHLGCASTRSGSCLVYPYTACNDNGSGLGATPRISNHAVAAGSTTLIRVSNNGTTIWNDGNLDFNFAFTPDCAADWDGDGDADSDDVIGFFSAWDSGEADVDGDGDTDSDDVVTFFGVWDSGC